jgi:ABC-2 type transport system ATP-binding protein
MDDSWAVEVTDLRKRYPRSSVDVVGGLSFSVPPGEIFGLLGPNGAGKTTTVGILTTRVLPTGGVARVAGVDVVAEPARARAELAVVPQRNNLDRSISVRQNLVFHASYHLVPAPVRETRADELLEQFGLADRAGDRPDDFSGGQAQRVMIARALMHSPQVLFLDEPATGLDPAARLFVWDRIRELRAAGTTVVITTHDMHEAAALCDRVGIVDHGQLLVLGSPAELIGAVPGQRTLDVQVVLAAGATEEQCVERLQRIDGVLRVEQVGAGGGWTGGSGGGSSAGGNGADGVGRRRLRLSVDGEAAALVAPVAAVIGACGAELAGVTIAEPSLEDVFIQLTGRALR